MIGDEIASRTGGARKAAADERGPAGGAALVVTRYGKSCLIERPDGSRAEARFRRDARDVVCGDRVILEETDDRPVITAVLPRDNEFPRADRRGERQVIAANLDRVVVVVAPEPAPTRDLLSRYLVACENVGVAAALCLNKVDRLADGAGDALAAQVACYEVLGYPVVRACAKRDDGVAALRELIRAGIHILVGQSGVGKSSLIDRLLPDRELETSALSRTTGKGRHTTTRTTLYHLPGGGAIMDSPGVWEYGIWAMTPQEIAAGFREFRPYLGACRFSDCTHRTEPACALRAAVDAGAVEAGRYESYLRVVRTT